ncbi:regulator [Salmonella enterica subsp. enterica serovar Muenchen]|nr:regulator [Salmonella enterica subsp. enterica serovar Muenchen]EEI2331274.1 regulator [Salmonella enterica subsp. enterica serovar Muenchen]EIM4274239.1 regulator [Salmonella enterica subsp. enterica serovar Mbandaka]EIN0668880.1 regulator [Salmonella enterica subsp. enterica serovar Mbandaka]EIQ9963842.1 regulator [Salmonella enterica subsp. enterica serovar Mbandaka]
MTVITYGKSTFAGNAKTRRHERRRKLAIERDTICNIIDSIFGCDAPDASQEVKAKRIDRVTKAISLAGTRQKEVEGGAVCLPEVALFAAGHRKSKQVTAR